jgi:RNA polymerase sigma factor (sigma-70 family)
MRLIPPPSACASLTLLDRARQGDQAAWEVLFEECYPKIVRVVRKRLSRPMRRIWDSTDIANEVMTSLAAKFDHFDFSSIDGLRAFLIKAAEQKVVDGYRRGHAKKRDISRDRALATGGSGGSGGFDPADSSPTASQVAVATEEFEILLDGQSGVDRTILELKSQGHSNREVAKATGWNLREIQRFLVKLRGTCRI